MLKKNLTLLVAILPLFTNAALVDHGTYATDTETNTDYLYLSQTVGYSYDVLVNQDRLGFIADGWELTSQTALFNMSVADRVLINDGADWPFTDIRGVNTIINNEDMSGGQHRVGEDLVDVDIWDDGTNFLIDPNIESIFDSNRWAAAVSLQRPSAVPLPASIWLLASGLLTLRALKKPFALANNS